MKLFDDTKLNSISSSSQVRGSKFAYVNQDFSCSDNSAIRRRCASWFLRIPEYAKAHLRESFRSKDDSQHNGAFFELFLHQLFTELGCEAEFQPSVRGKTPDFLLNGKDAPFIVEATVAGAASNPLDLGPNEQKVLDDLNKLHSSHFYLLYDVENTPNTMLSRTTPSAKYITNKVKKLLADNDPNDVRSIVENFGRRAAPSQKIEWQDGSMTVWLSPRPAYQGSESDNQSIVLGRMNAKRIDPISSVREALTDKAKAYNKLGVPLIVAVNAANPFFHSDECELNVLWGDLSVQYEMRENDRTRHVRRDNGFWSSETSRSTAGVLVFRNADILNMFQASATLHISPHFGSSGLPSALLRLPHYIDIDGCHARNEGEDIAQLLGVRLK